MEFHGLVSAVGIFSHATEDRQYVALCCQARKQCIRFLVTQLDDQSSFLVSPFYEHSVTLNEVEDEQCEWGLVYRLVEWHSYTFRIPETVQDEKEYAKRARDIVRHSFYPLMKRDAQPAIQPWQRRCFDWHSFYRGLASTYTTEFQHEEWLAREATPAQYWSAFNQRFACISDTIKSLRLDVKTVVVHDLAHLHQQLDAWYQCAHFAGYLKYRLADMPLVQRVASRALSLVKFAHLSSDRLTDLDTLYEWLASDQDTTPDYKDFATLLGQSVPPQATQGVLDHFDDGTTEKRARVLDGLVARKIITEVERQAARSSSTCYPVSVKSVLYHYCRLFGLQAGVDCATVTLHEDWSLGGDKEEAEAHRADLTFDHQDVGQVVNHFYNLVGGPPSSWSTYAWHHLTPAWSDTLCLKLTASLCYVVSRPALNHQEEALRTLLCDTLQCSVTVDDTPSQWDPASAQRQYDGMDDIDAALYDLRAMALLYRPVEMTVQSADLVALRGVLAENIFTCSVVRPPGSDYSLRRVETFFSSLVQAPTLADLRACFYEPDAAVARETVAVLDCHLFSVGAMLGLFRWIAASKTSPQPVRRLVLLGAQDCLPLQTEGQAWQDVLAWLGYETALFQHASANASLDELIESRVDSRLLKQSYFDPGASAVQDYLVQQLAGLAKRPDSLRLCCLVPEQQQQQQRQTRKKPDPLVGLIESGVTAKFRANNNVRVETMTLGQLTTWPMSRHQANTGYYFFVSRHYMQQLSRNELNHLLMELPTTPLIVVCDERPPKSFKWLLESECAHQKVPNARYTLRYLYKILPPPV